MKLSIIAGATSQSVNVFIADSASSTGGGKTALVFNTSGLTAYYSFSGANATATAITLATLAAVTSAYSSGGFKEIDSTNMPGWYRLDIPNAALATAKGRSVSIHLQGASGMAPCPIEIELTAWDNQDGIRGGMVAMPNQSSGASGGLLVSGTNSGTTTFGNLTVSGAITGNITGNLSGSVGSVTSTVLKKNTALANFEFMMTDSTAHAPATGKTVTCTRSIDGGAFGAGTLANVNAVSNGIYRVDFGAGDLNGNVITLRATATGCDDTFITLLTSP